MPKYRKLHVKTTESLDVNNMPDDTTRLAWVLLPLALCREGRGIYNPAWLKSKIFPLRTDITSEHVKEMMNTWECMDMIRPYRVDGRDYFYVPTFIHYQGSTIKEAESIYPPPPGWSDDEPTPKNDDDEGDECPDPLQSSSISTPDLLQSKSSTDSYSDSNANSNSEAEAEAEAAATAAQGGRSPPKFITAQEAERLFTTITGMPTFPSGSRPDDIERICKLVSSVGEDITWIRMTDAFRAWTDRGYRRTNTNWLDWAVAGEIPERRDGRKKETAFDRRRKALENDG